MGESAKSRLYVDKSGQAAPLMYPKADQTLTAGGTSVRSLAFEEASVVRVWAKEDCFVKAGDSSVEATSADEFIGAGFPIEVPLGEGNEYLAVIQLDTGGSVFLHEYA